MVQLKSIKGQSEVVGLLVIVIILVFMGLIYLGFSNIADSGSLASERSSIEVENALNAVLRTNLPDFEDRTMEDLIVECGGGNCDELDTVVGDVFSSILKHGANFEFSSYREEVEIYATGSCEFGLASNYMFIKGGVVYEAKLKLC
jgi:hypothetical protein